MTNLRVVDLLPIDSRKIKIIFTEKLGSLISIDNVEIQSITKNIPNAQPQKVIINNNVLYIITTPLTPQAFYKVRLFSTNLRPFKSIAGSILYEDGNTNEPIIEGPHNPENFFLNRMVDFLKNNPYDVENPGIIRTYLETSSNLLYKAYNDIKQAKSDNYLSIGVIDEVHRRAKGPYDRLLNEGVFEITRVGLLPTETISSKEISFSSFPSEPVSLQQEEITNEKLFFGEKNISSTFNQTICTLSKSNIIKINKIYIQYSDGLNVLYNIDSFGYLIKNSRYDTRASTYLLLENNQFKFSDKAILEGFRVPVAGDNVTVSYYYKNTGRIINENSVNIYSTNKQVREPCLPLMTVFSISYAPICDKDGKISESDGVLFLDPLSTPPFSATHPAFKKEITFSENKLPIHIGEYSVDYENGKVYVYGVDAEENPGSGLFPPAMTYFYRQVYQNGIDYNYESSLKELAANPKRDLIDKQTVITFDYEDVLIPEIDYKEQIHKEKLDERAENRIIGDGAIQTLHTPITNVFKVFNETTGETYGINRFNDNTIFFSYRTPPLFIKLIKERVKFEQISGESLVKTDEFDNASSVRIFKFVLGTLIVSNTEDSIGSSINTSMYFDNTNVFEKELYYSEESDIENINLITSFGEYIVNYTTGTIWVGVSGIQTDDVGTVSYKTKNITTDFPHISNVTQVYSFIDEEISKTKYTINTFTDTTVDLIEYLPSDNEKTLLSIDTIETFEQISAVRKIFDKEAIVNKVDNPINFATNAVTSFSSITVYPIEYFKTLAVEADGVTIIVPDLIYTNSKAKIENIISIKKQSTGEEVYFTTNSDGSFTNNTITLPSDTTAISGENVFIRINVFLLNDSAVIVDYNRGEMYIDYIFCNDEVIISYEYGDNCLDFRNVSDVLEEGKIYYVSYKYGALRDALFDNFGTLINIDLLKNFNVDLKRERYRDAIKACLQTFPKGSQVQAIKNIAKIISHAEPEIWESFNDEWILGQGFLYNNEAETSGALSLVPGKFNYSIDVSNSDESILLPFSSHVKLEKGTLEMFVIPKWDGIDNDAELSFYIERDGYVLPFNHIWIGAQGYHPTLNYQNLFTLIKEEKNYGLPADISNNQYGAFIYYDIDDKKWKILFKDENNNHIYSCKILTDGEFYNVKPLLDILDVGDKITTKSKEIEILMTIDLVETDGYSLDGYVSGFSFDGVTFMSDKEHYFFDYLADLSKLNENRISLLKDGRGYLTFKVFSKRDYNNKSHLYQLSKDISDWKNGDVHFVAMSWRLATKDKRDEIHLFVDGEEVPNILKFGGRPVASATDRFRTIVPEIISTPVPYNTLTNIDLKITNGSDVVVSENSDFGISGISVGNKLYIDDPIIEGPDGYFTILEIVTGNSVRLNYTFNFNMTDVGFTVNPWSVPVSTNIIYESNIAVSILSGGEEIELPGLRALVPSYSVDITTEGQPLLIVRGNAKAGDQVAIRTLGLNHKRIKEKYYNWGTISNHINTFLPPPINLDQVKIVPIIFNRTNVDISSPIYSPDVQPSSNNGGRTLEIIISNVSNCDFSVQDVEIEISGNTYSGSSSETITASQAGSYFTTEQFETIADIECSASVFDSTTTSFALEIKEAYSLTYQENDGYFAILRYSNKESSLSELEGYDDNIISSSPVFDNIHLGYGLVFTNPNLGSFVISEVLDAYHVKLANSLSSSFSDGYADLYNINISRSGYSNGLFTLELAEYYGFPFYLLEGYYELDYASYLDIPFEIKNLNCSVGSDLFKQKQAKSVLEELRSLNVLSSDTRVGERLIENERSITSDYNTVKAFTPNSETILLMHFDQKPIIDSSVPYSFYDSDFIQADKGVNNNFSSSLYINEVPLVLDNTNIFFNNEGSIEFWVSPRFDTANDPKHRMYFDAVSSSFETVSSLTKRDLVLNRAAKYIISITVDGFPNINYADGAIIGSDSKMIRLGKELPNQQMNLQVIYIPFRGKGDRISIYKSSANSINFDITANGKLSSLSTPIFWSRDSWHKIMVNWKCNTNKNQDEIKLFVDGVQKNKIVFGLGLNFSSIYTFNQLMTSSSVDIKTTINLREKFSKLFIGGNSFGGQLAYARFDNFKISKKQKRIITIGDQQTDNDYNSDTSRALPAIKDNYTTYLMDFDKEVVKIEDFSILKNEMTGIFDFDLDVIDSFSIIKDDPRVKELLETLIKQLKPAVSRAFIKYLR